MTSQTKAELAESIRDLLSKAYAEHTFSMVFSRRQMETILAALRAEPAGEPEQCPMCKGSGQRPVTSFSDHNKTIMKSCSVCRGRGVLFSHPPSPSALADGLALIDALLEGEQDWHDNQESAADAMGYIGPAAWHKTQRKLLSRMRSAIDVLSALPPVAGEAGK